MGDSLGCSSQLISFQGDEDSQGHELIDSDVIVYGTIRQNTRGSSKVKLKNIVDYKWETKNYPGHLIAVHMDGKCVAYVIKVSNKVMGAEGMVRVICAGKRALIKGMTGEVLDIQFAYNEKQHILACAEANVLHIYKIDIKSENLVCNILLEIDDSISHYIPKYDKLAWCPYVPDEVENDEDAKQLIVWARGNSFQCFNISIVLKNYGNGKHSINRLREGHLKFVDKAVIITWVALSPDGTTLSVGSTDGYIRFYQVYFHEKQPRCLHQWNPHNGKPISSFFFLDNLTKSYTDAYWKYALTGADRNTEFKIWDCGTWDCLQMLSFRSNDADKLTFIAEIDLTASYLIVSSIEINVVYVVQLVNGTVDREKNKICLEKNESKSPAYIKDEVNSKINFFMKSISEFPLSSPILSFSIVDATIRKYKYQESESLLADDLDDYEEDNNAAFCVVIRMFVVQPKSVQECHIIYQPTVSDTTDVRSSLSSTSNHADVSLDVPQRVVSSKERILEVERHTAKSAVVNACESPKSHSNHVNLMTPDSFTTKIDTKSSESVSSEVLSTILMLANVTNSNVCNPTTDSINLFHLANNSIDNRSQQCHEGMNIQKGFHGNIQNDPRQPITERLLSGGSSPSREVQQILAKSPLTQNSNYCLEKLGCEVERLASHVEADNAQFDNDSFDVTVLKSDVENWPQLKNSEINKIIPDKPSLSQCNAANSDEIKDLNSKFDQLIDILQIQSAELNYIKKEVVEIKKHNINLLENMNRPYLNNEINLPKVLEDCFIRHEKLFEDRIENLISIRNLQCQELNENILLVLKQFLFDQFPEKQTSLMSLEIQKQITSVVLEKFNVMEHHVHNEITKKLATTHQLIKDNLIHLCKSKSFVDTFGESIVTGVQRGLQNTYIQSMSSTLIPAYEKSSREMFKQLHETFSLGIKDVIEQFDGFLCQLPPLQEGIEGISGKIQGLINYIETALAKQNAGGVENYKELKKDIKCLENSIINNISGAIQKEVRKNFETQAATFEDSVLTVVRSQVHTPAPSVYDVQDQIRYLLYQGQINKAFHQALIANDLVLVEYVLEKADYKHVFNPCALEQTVLLSLIQQISADMENHNDFKQRYLADAILNLNYNDPIIKEHAPRVMKEFCKNCQNFLKNHPKSHLCSSIRMILMAVQGMGFKVV